MEIEGDRLPNLRSPIVGGGPVRALEERLVKTLPHGTRVVQPGFAHAGRYLEQTVKLHSAVGLLVP